VAAVIRGVLAQRLVRRICPHCRESFEPEAHSRAEIELVTGPIPHFARGAGCARCRGSGFAGRLGVFELLVPDENFTVAVSRGATLQELTSVVVEQCCSKLRELELEAPLLQHCAVARDWG
jgi:type IV pilus assembly protein PilB